MKEKIHLQLHFFIVTKISLAIISCIGVLQLFYFIALSISATLIHYFESPTLAKYWIVVVVMIFWFVFLILIFKIWVSGHTVTCQGGTNEHNYVIESNLQFDDHFNFRCELTLMCINIFIFVPLRSWLAIKFKVSQETETANIGLVWTAFATLLSLMLPTLIQTIVPYRTWKTTQLARSEKQLAIQISNQNAQTEHLFDILSDKHAFFLFVNHAVQELNLENISFIMTLYQFKHLKCSKNESQTSLHVNEEIHIEMPETSDIKPVETENVSAASNVFMTPLPNTHRKINDTPISISNDNFPNTSQIRQKLKKHKQKLFAYSSDLECYTNKILQLPWTNFPLTEPMANFKDNKFMQAKRMYDMYLDTASIYSINISGAAHGYIDDKFKDIKYYYNNNNKKGYNGSIKSYQ
eukprot:299197_1